MLLCGMMEVFMSSSYCIEKIQKDRRERKRYALKNFHVEYGEWKLKPLLRIAKIKPMTTLARRVVSTVDLDVAIVRLFTKVDVRLRNLLPLHYKGRELQYKSYAAKGCYRISHNGTLLPKIKQLRRLFGI